MIKITLNDLSWGFIRYLEHIIWLTSRMVWSRKDDSEWPLFEDFLSGIAFVILWHNVLKVHKVKTLVFEWPLFADRFMYPWCAVRNWLGFIVLVVWCCLRWTSARYSGCELRLQVEILWHHYLHTSSEPRLCLTPIIIVFYVSDF